jgi:hypothetical protein
MLEKRVDRRRTGFHAVFLCGLLAAAFALLVPAGSRAAGLGPWHGTVTVDQKIDLSAADQTFTYREHIVYTLSGSGDSDGVYTAEAQYSFLEETVALGGPCPGSDEVYSASGSEPSSVQIQQQNDGRWVFVTGGVPISAVHEVESHFLQFDGSCGTSTDSSAVALTLPLEEVVTDTQPDPAGTRFVGSEIYVDPTNVVSWDLAREVMGTAPTISAPANVSVPNNPGVCTATVSALPSFAATGDPVPTVTVSGIPAGSRFPVGTSTVSGRASNGIAPDASASYDVTVVDAEKPTISAPPNVVVDATGPTGAVVGYAPFAAHDNCPGVRGSVSKASGSIFPIGTTTVTGTATDSAGNSSSASFTVRVRGAAAQAADLLASVIGLGPGKALGRDVSRVLAAIATGNRSAACSALGDFVGLVTAQRGKKLTAARADALLVAAQRLRRVLGC